MDMLEILGPGGMSGDETDGTEEQNGFKAKILAQINEPWRSKDVTRGLHYIDCIAYEKILSRQGNPGLERRVGYSETRTLSTL